MSIEIVFELIRRQSISQLVKIKFCFQKGILKRVSLVFLFCFVGFVVVVVAVVAGTKKSKMIKIRKYLACGAHVVFIERETRNYI